MIISTLSIGEKYDNLAAALLGHLSGAGNEVVVSTLNRSKFPHPIQSVLCPQDGTFIWHQKRHALRAALERSRDVIFIDSDYRLYPWKSKIPFLPPFEASGLWSCATVLNLGSMRLQHLGDQDTISSGKSSLLLNEASEKFGIDWKQMWWWGDCLFGISDPNGDFGFKFVDFWDRFAEWVRDKVIGNFCVLNFDGVAMAFAAAHCGLTPKDASSYFKSIRETFQHLQGSA